MRIFGLVFGVWAALFALPSAGQSVLNEDGTFSLLPRAVAIKEELTRSQVLSEDLQQFYAGRSYVPVWLTSHERRTALIEAVRGSEAHGLPTQQYGLSELEILDGMTALSHAHGAELEIAFNDAFVKYARHVTSGVLTPKDVNWEIQHEPRVFDASELLRGLIRADSSAAYFDAILPKTQEYQALLAERVRLSELIRNEQAIPRIPTRGMMRIGYRGSRVLMVRERLTALGYTVPGEGPVYDAEMAEVVRQFQQDHKLTADAVLGPATFGALNKSSSDRMEHVLVNLERHRWMNHDRSGRHIEVNLADFTMKVLDDEVVTFRSKVVVGKTGRDYRTPEFSEAMTHLVVNPYWHVPRSIAGREYLPLLKQDPMALANRGMLLLNRRGQILNTAGADFSAYTAKNFPFFVKQPPGNRNALGRVKFMFPNVNNIYLHDTPAKKLFRRDRRAYSHGCVRVHRPFELAYHLMAPQEADPEGAFKYLLNKRRERQVNLDTPVPVHLLYNTAFMAEDGSIAYREDIYNRDRAVFQALLDAGVEVADLSG